MMCEFVLMRHVAMFSPFSASGMLYVPSGFTVMPRMVESIVSEVDLFVVTTFITASCCSCISAIAVWCCASVLMACRVMRREVCSICVW